MGTSAGLGGDATEPVDEEIDRARRSLQLVQRAFYVSGREGPPAEGRLPFNPLYYHLLGIVLEEGPQRPSELAAQLGTAKSTVSTAVAALGRRGLVAKKPDPSDGRANLVYLTADGVDVAEAIRRQDLRNVAALLSLFDADERASVIGTLDRITNHLIGG